MKAYILLALCISVNSINFGQNFQLNDSIQVHYNTGRMGGAIGGQDHSVTIWIEGGFIYCQRKCYSMFNDKLRQNDTRLSYIDSTFTQERYQKYQRDAILQFYQDNDNFIILDDRVKISQSQFDKFIKIVDEIRAFNSENNLSTSEEILIITTKRNHYVIRSNDKNVVIIDWFGHYDRSKDIEKSLGLKSYSRCPCVIDDIDKHVKRKKPQ